MQRNLYDNDLYGRAGIRSAQGGQDGAEEVLAHPGAHFGERGLLRLDRAVGGEIVRQVNITSVRLLLRVKLDCVVGQLEPPATMVVMKWTCPSVERL